MRKRFKHFFSIFLLGAVGMTIPSPLFAMEEVFSPAQMEALSELYARQHPSRLQPQRVVVADPATQELKESVELLPMSAEPEKAYKKILERVKQLFIQLVGGLKKGGQLLTSKEALEWLTVNAEGLIYLAILIVLLVVFNKPLMSGGRNAITATKTIVTVIGTLIRWAIKAEDFISRAFSLAITEGL